MWIAAINDEEFIEGYNNYLWVLEMEGRVGVVDREVVWPLEEGLLGEEGITLIVDTEEEEFCAEKFSFVPMIVE
jgi:hypothetical protein